MWCPGAVWVMADSLIGDEPLFWGCGGGGGEWVRTVFCFLSGKYDGQLWARMGRASGHICKNQFLDLLPSWVILTS